MVGSNTNRLDEIFDIQIDNDVGSVLKRRCDDLAFALLNW